MHEHGCKKGQPNDRWTRRLRDFDGFVIGYLDRLGLDKVDARGNLFWNNTPAVGKGWIGNLNQKQQYVGGNQTVRNKGARAYLSVVIADWEKHESYFKREFFMDRPAVLLSSDTRIHAIGGQVQAHACVLQFKGGLNMRAWLLPKTGSIDGLRLESHAAVKPREGEVALRVLYSALNPADRYLAEGQYPARPTFPHILGRDGLGIVVEVGDAVSNWKPGDKALLLRGEAGVSRPGTLAEQVVVPADCLESVPDGWSDQQAACAALVYVTAYQSLTQWGDLPPSVVLISGATGGVGVAAVQLANAMGHTVVALSRSQAKGDQLPALGASVVLNSNDPEWTVTLKRQLNPRRVDLVVDNIGGELLPRMIDTLGMWGRISLVGMLAGPVPQLNTASLFFRRIRMGGVAVNSYSLDENRAAWLQVLKLLRSTGQKPIIDSVYSMEQVPAAFARLAEGPMGKVLVNIGADPSLKPTQAGN